jgi:predicted SprT family Zn-dependent metalloprotease
MRIKKLYEDIKKVMPNEYHYKIKICSSYPEMVRFLVKKNKMKKDYRKVAKKFSKEIETDKEYNKDYAVSRELAKKYPRRRLKKYARPILGFSGNPILLNAGVLHKESKYYVAAVILHEIGHNSGYLSEGGADKFALEWMEKVELFIKDRIY